MGGWLRPLLSTRFATMTARLAIALATWLPMLAACGRCDETSTPVALEPAPTPAAPAVEIAIHEWGLVGHHVSRREEALLNVVAGPGSFPPPEGETPMVIGKPVIYVHLPPDARDVPFSLAVRLSGGGVFAEHWPPAASSAEGGEPVLRWGGARASTTTCAGSDYPRVASERCTGVVDGYCEAAELSRYETGESACLAVGDSAVPLLFYRARARIAPPLSATVEGEAVTLRNTGTEAIPGQLIRVLRGDSDTDTRVRVAAPPAPGASVEVPLPGDADLRAGGALEALRAGLGELGMTEAEARAFLGAWHSDLLGSQGSLGPPAVQTGPPPADLHPARDALLYFLPPPLLDAAVPITMEPAPATVRRAMLVRIDLSTPLGHGSGASSRPQNAGPGAPTVTIGDIAVDGGLDPSMAERAFRRFRAPLLDCYERTLRATPELTATLQLGLTVSGSGEVSAATVVRSSAAVPTLAPCLVEKLRRLRFPASANATPTRLTVTLDFGRAG